MTMRLVHLGLLSGAALLIPSLLWAQGLRVSPDTAVVLGGVTVEDEAVAEDDLAGSITLANVGPLPAGADLTAYHVMPNGDELLAFDTTVGLPGVTVEPGDVVRFDGTGYALAFDASAAGVPAGAYADAVTNDGIDLVLSFDTTVSLGGTAFDDADLVRFDGLGFSSVFDSGAAGVPDGLDLDAAHILADGTLQISFDTSGKLGGVSFDDEDVLGFDPATGAWSMVYDGSAHHAAWAAADLDALRGSVLQAGPTECDIDGDGDIDRNDVMLIIAVRNSPASGPDDPRDSDDDGQITVLDARVCVLQCTLPYCAVN
jgi:hypothetical protein